LKAANDKSLTAFLFLIIPAKAGIYRRVRKPYGNIANLLRIKSILPITAQNTFKIFVKTLAK